MLDSLLDLIFPPRCVGCKRHGELFCAPCIERCRGMRHVASTTRRKPHDDVLASMEGVYRYDAPLRDAIIALKYRRRRRLAEPLGALFVAGLPAHVHECAVVVPVPLHGERLRERGFNQSELLARHVAGALGKPLGSGLLRVRSTARQVGLAQAAREANVRGAFDWYGGTEVPHTILLIDDVVTTGSTMRDCARALRAAGAQQVHGLALASGDR
jgi:ComF family protein